LQGTSSASREYCANLYDRARCTWPNIPPLYGHGEVTSVPGAFRSHKGRLRINANVEIFWRSILPRSIRII
jgi:hypothetical protein